MAFKMNNPMKKNFGSALKSNKFLGELAAARKKGDKTFNVGGKTFDVKDSATPKLKDNAPMMRMDASAMKAMGQPAPVKMSSHPMKQDDDDLDKFMTDEELEEFHKNMPTDDKSTETVISPADSRKSKELKELKTRFNSGEIDLEQYNVQANRILNPNAI